MPGQGARPPQILEAMPDPPSYTAMRTLLTILEKKGHVRHSVDGPRYVYEPAMPREQMGRRAIGQSAHHLLRQLVEAAVAAMLAHEDVAPDQLDRLAALIDKAKKEGR